MFCQEVNLNDSPAGDSSTDNILVQPASNSMPPRLGNYVCNLHHSPHIT